MITTTIIIYFCVAFGMWISSIVVYAGKTDDVEDYFFFTLVSMCLSVVWPITSIILLVWLVFRKRR